MAGKTFKRLSIMAEVKTVQVFGVFFTPEEIKERSTWHETTWFETEIPKEIEDSLSKFLEEKMKEFYKKCDCGLCKLHQQ